MKSARGELSAARPPPARGRSIPPPVCPTTQHRHLPQPYENDLSASSWNTQGLFCQKLGSCKTKMAYCLELSRQYDIVGLQEVHCNRSLHRSIDCKLIDGARSWWSPVLACRNLGGVGLILRGSFLAKFVEFGASKAPMFSQADTCVNMLRAREANGGLPGQCAGRPDLARLRATAIAV